MLRCPFEFTLAFLLFVGLALLCALFLNEGYFTYSIDDPYIHLALAEQIWRGHYGLNAAELSSPSSSIVWPFLLAPFSVFSWFEAAPFLLNLTAALVFLEVGWRIISRFFEHNNVRMLMLVILVLGSNLIGLIFAGMEHSLQLLCVALLVQGLLEQQRTGQAGTGLAAAIIIGPLVRYENLALSLATLLLLSSEKKLAVCLLAGSALLASLGSFSVYLHWLGLGWLPASVAVKSAIFGSSEIWQVLPNLDRNLHYWSGAVLACICLALIWHAWRTALRRKIVIWICAVIILHLCFGSMGWFSRYEAYLITATMLVLMYLFNRQIIQYLESVSWLKRFSAATALLLLVSFPLLRDTILIPLGCNNIYQQHYQMRRFVTAFYRRPVAANDIGLLSFGNPYYVFDLMGLSSKDVRQAKRRPDFDSTLNTLIRQRDIKLAMVYRDWFKRWPPPQWVPLGELRLGRPRVSIAKPTVIFCSLEEAASPELIAKLRRFAATLPAGVQFEFQN